AIRRHRPYGAHGTVDLECTVLGTPALVCDQLRPCPFLTTPGRWSGSHREWIVRNTPSNGSFRSTTDISTRPLLRRPRASLRRIQTERGKQHGAVVGVSRESGHTTYRASPVLIGRLGADS